MEICKAIDGNSDLRLQAKFKHALDVIERTLALYRFDEVAFSFNGGKDSTALLHLLRAGHAVAESKIGVQSDLPHSIRTIYFESPDAFPEIDAFTYENANLYNLQLEVLRQDFKSGLEALLKSKPTKAIFLGTRIGDPNAVGQEQFAPSSAGWPPFMRVNPILDWSYRDVWAFLLVCKVPYCKLYDQGYTSIGSIHDTVPNEALFIGGGVDGEAVVEMEQCPPPTKKSYRPAYLLRDGRLERAGRRKRSSVKKQVCTFPSENGGGNNSLYSASIVTVGDEFVRGDLEEKFGVLLSKELYCAGWTVTRRALVPNDIDAVCEEVEQRASTSDIVLISGGVGSLHCDVTLAGVAKAFGVRLAPDEEFEEYLRHKIGENCSGDKNEMAKLPEGITHLLYHTDISSPIIKCLNVIVFPGPTMKDLEGQLKCLMELSKGSKELLSIHHPFYSIKLKTRCPEVEVAKSLSQVAAEYPDLTMSCHRQVEGGVKFGVISIVGKGCSRVKSAASCLTEEALVEYI